MKVRIGLSDNLKRDPIWCTIWHQLGTRLENFPFELIAINSGDNPWLIVDLQNGPFILSLAESRINLPENLSVFQRTGRLEFYFESQLINFMNRGIDDFVIKRAVFPGALAPDAEQAFKNSAAERLAIVYSKRTPVFGAAEFIQDTDNSLIIVCKDAGIDEKLHIFFNKMHEQGWRFEQIL